MSPLSGRVKDLVNPKNNPHLDYAGGWYGEFAHDITDIRNGAFIYIMEEPGYQFTAERRRSLRGAFR